MRLWHLHLADIAGTLRHAMLREPMLLQWLLSSRMTRRGPLGLCGIGASNRPTEPVHDGAAGAVAGDVIHVDYLSAVNRG